jgi:hypothetical protein
VAANGDSSVEVPEAVALLLASAAAAAARAARAAAACRFLAVLLTTPLATADVSVDVVIATGATVAAGAVTTVASKSLPLVVPAHADDDEADEAE